MVLWTKDTFYVAREGDPTVVDSIPLHELLAVMEMDGDSENSSTFRNTSFTHDVQNATDCPRATSGGLRGARSGVTGGIRGNVRRRGGGSDLGLSTDNGEDVDGAELRSWTNCLQANYTLQIKTVPDGLNSGRTYYLSTRNGIAPEARRQAIVETLREAAEVARRRAEAKSRFERSQERAQWVQGSMAFQVFMATLIMVVRGAPPTPQPTSPRPAAPARSRGSLKARSSLFAGEYVRIHDRGAIKRTLNLVKGAGCH
jgi:hypothetical protein